MLLHAFLAMALVYGLARIDVGLIGGAKISMFSRGEFPAWQSPRTAEQQQPPREKAGQAAHSIHTALLHAWIPFVCLYSIISR